MGRRRNLMGSLGAAAEGAGGAAGGAGIQRGGAVDGGASLNTLSLDLEEAAPPPARRIASHVTTAALPVAEPVVQSPTPTETGVVSSETAGENSALK